MLETLAGFVVEEDFLLSDSIDKNFLVRFSTG